MLEAQHFLWISQRYIFVNFYLSSFLELCWAQDWETRNFSEIQTSQALSLDFGAAVMSIPWENTFYWWMCALQWTCALSQAVYSFPFQTVYYAYWNANFWEADDQQQNQLQDGWVLRGFPLFCSKHLLCS